MRFARSGGPSNKDVMIQNVPIDVNSNIHFTAMRELPDACPFRVVRQGKALLDLVRRCQSSNCPGRRANEGGFRFAIPDDSLDRRLVVGHVGDNGILGIPFVSNQSQHLSKSDGIERMRREPAQVPIGRGNLQEEFVRRRIGNQIGKEGDKILFSFGHEPHNPRRGILVIGELNQLGHRSSLSLARARKRWGSSTEKRAMTSARARSPLKRARTWLSAICKSIGIS